MRAEHAGARTWLYAVLAGWAACVWILAMFGMGGSIDRLDDDPSLRQALPAPVAPEQVRPGPLSQYGELAARPLFTDDRRPQPFVIDPMGEEAAAGSDFDYVLTSVLRTPDLEMAIVQPSGGGEPLRVRLGDAPESAPGWVLQSVQARGAVFAGPQGERRLELRVFDGIGGQAPTRVAMPEAAGPAPPRPAPEPMSGAPAAVVDADAPVPAAMAPDAVHPGGGPATTGGGPQMGMAQQQGAQEQVEAIRQRIEERRARLRADEMAESARQRGNRKK